MNIVYFSVTLVFSALFGSTTLSRCQISSTYSWMVLSELNFPEQATFSMALFAQFSSFR